MHFFKKIVVIVLTWEARMTLRRYRPRIVAITGSVGKTTTKDAIYAALSPKLLVRKSEKSFNSEIGVPLTILGMENAWRNPFKWLANIVQGLAPLIVRRPYPQWLVVEVGADRPGDVRAIARWLRPDIAVLTGVPEVPVHVEYFASPEALVREKRALAEYLKPGGKLVVNGDDPRMLEIRSDFRGASITYGLEAYNDYVGSHDEIVYDNATPVGVRFRVNHMGASVPVVLHGALGTPRIYAALAALAVAQEVGIDFVSASQSLALWEATPGRLRILPGLRGSTILDDTYNSSPVAVLAALDALAKVSCAGRRIAVLGDMLELGKYSADAHREVGERAAACADVLITIGFRSRATAEAARDAGMKDKDVREYEMNESERAGLELEKEIREGDVILVKGSQGLRMERAVYPLLEDTTKAPELLVRQDEEWQKR